MVVVVVGGDDASPHHHHVTCETPSTLLSSQLICCVYVSISKCVCKMPGRRVFNDTRRLRRSRKGPGASSPRTAQTPATAVATPRCPESVSQ